jgi:hypothetical protein
MRPERNFMNVTHSIHDLVHRLERTADLIDDLANSDCIASEELREWLFRVEAQIWRVSRQVSKSTSHDHHLVARGLVEIRDALRACVRLRVGGDDDALAQLESHAYEVARAYHAIEVHCLPGAFARAGGGRS